MSHSITINLSSQREARGFVEREVTARETTETGLGLGQEISIRVWVQNDDSEAVLVDRAREEAIAFLKRAFSSLELR